MQLIWINSVCCVDSVCQNSLFQPALESAADFVLDSPIRSDSGHPVARSANQGPSRRILAAKANTLGRPCVGAVCGPHKRRSPHVVPCRHSRQDRTIVPSRHRLLPLRQNGHGTGQFAGPNAWHLRTWGAGELFDRILASAYSRLIDGAQCSIGRSPWPLNSLEPSALSAFSAER